MKAVLRITCMIFAFALLLAVAVGCDEIPVEASNDLSATPDAEQSNEESKEGAKPNERSFTILWDRAEVPVYETCLWTNYYSTEAGAWLTDDVTSIESVLSSDKSKSAQIYGKNFRFEYSESIMIDEIFVFSDLGQELVIENDSLDELKNLPDGIWTVGVYAIGNGDYVADQKKYETVGLLYCFKLIITPEDESTCFCGVIKEIDGNRSLVLPFADEFYPNLPLNVYLGEGHDFKVNDQVVVFYDGWILEEYPGIPSGIKSVEHYNGKFVSVNGVGNDAQELFMSSRLWEEKESGEGGWVLKEEKAKEPTEMTRQEREAIPEIVKNGKISLAILDHEEYSITLYDAKTLEKLDCGSFGATDFNKLLRGEYFVSVTRTSLGGFIESAVEKPRELFGSDEHYYKANASAFETVTSKYLFKLIVE